MNYNTKSKRLALPQYCNEEKKKRRKTWMEAMLPKARQEPTFT